jgi:hypothetical protein
MFLLGMTRFFWNTDDTDDTDDTDFNAFGIILFDYYTPNGYWFAKKWPITH